jgi:glucose/mannose-6-phosphate isomerase
MLEAFPNQIKDGWELGADMKFSDVTRIVISGMGGSALSGEILRSYLHDTLKIPLEVNKDYHLPKYIDENTLVIVSSYSGDTEETVEAFKDANRRSCKILVISAGGRLGEMAKQFRKPFAKMPSGFPPRLAYGYSFFALLRILQNSGLIPNQVPEIKNLLTAIKKDVFKKKAEELAEKLDGKIPIIYSSQRLASVAYKWKIDFNENSKIHAFCNYFPELNHNEMVGYTKLNGDYFVLIIKDDYDDAPIKKRMEVTKHIIQQHKCPVLDLEVAGVSLLTKIFTAIYLGDWTSYFLALINNIDPTPVDVVENFKKKLVI